MTDLTNIKRKIAALLAKAEGTDNEFEAATFMAKVNELLEAHQLSIYQLGDESDLMGKQEGEFNVYASMSWAKILIHQIAMFYNTETVWWRVGNHLKYEVVGRESNRITTELMIPFIIAQVRQRGRILANETGRTHSVATRDVGQALTTRIWAEIQKNKPARDAHAAKMLIPVDEVKAYLNDAYKGFKTGKARVLKTSQSARDHADRIAIQRQAPNAKGTLAITG